MKLKEIVDTFLKLCPDFPVKDYPYFAQDLNGSIYAYRAMPRLDGDGDWVGGRYLHLVTGAVLVKDLNTVYLFKPEPVYKSAFQLDVGDECEHFGKVLKRITEDYSDVTYLTFDKVGLMKVSKDMQFEVIV